MHMQNQKQHNLKKGDRVLIVTAAFGKKFYNAIVVIDHVDRLGNVYFEDGNTIHCANTREYELLT